jgi:glycosyltransferase involved in cell wall biosynthesis
MHVHGGHFVLFQPCRKGILLLDSRLALSMCGTQPKHRGFFSMSRRTATISIVMTSYNGERYLPEQIDTLLGQTRQPDQLVVSDDNSNDNSRGIIDAKLEGAGFRCEIIHNANRLGYVRNFISALRHATGDIIFLCDQDDLWHPRKLARVAEMFVESSSECISHDISIYYCSGSTPEFSYFRRLEAAGRSGAVQTHGCATAFTRSLLEKSAILESEFSVAHDTWICLTGEVLGTRIILDEILMRYRIHDNNTVGKVLQLGRLEKLSSVIRKPFWKRKPSSLNEFVTSNVGFEEIRLAEFLLQRNAEFISATHRKAVLKTIAARKRLLTAQGNSHRFWRIVSATMCLFRGDYACGNGLIGFLRHVRHN